MKDYARQFYKSKAWLNCRASFIATRQLVNGGLCEMCGDKLGYIVHHKEAITPTNINNPNITLNHANLMYVCKECHDQFDGHGVGKSLTPQVFFDDNGDVMPPIKTKK